jgi:hypothetical protein
MSAVHGRASARAVRHALVLTGALLAGGAADAGAAVPPGFYGVNAGGGLVNDAAARPAALQAMGAGGLSFVRVDASWGAVEPLPPVAGVHTYVWAVYDLWVADLARFGLRWYPMLGYSAAWARPAGSDTFAPPAGDADFAAFAAALAARYGSGGSFWAAHPELPNLPTIVYGIWNEPSYDHFWSGPEATPARYMSLYLAAHAAIKSVDPGARVAAGELLDSGTIDGAAYLRAMLDSAPAARGQIDAVAWHPYVGDVDQVLESVRRARVTLAQYGLGHVPIEVTEVGVHSAYDPAWRARWLHDLAMKLPNAGLNVTRLIPYAWIGDPTWQITDADGTPGLIGGSYFNGIRDAAAYSAPAAALPAPARVTKAPATKKKAKASTICQAKPAKKGSAAKQARPPKRCASTVSKAAKARKAGARARARARATARKAKARARAKARATARKARARAGRR